jgi:hypothetical protein
MCKVGSTSEIVSMEKSVHSGEMRNSDAQPRVVPANCESGLPFEMMAGEIRPRLYG